MALKDVKDYFYSLQTSYFDMRDLVDRLDQELKNGNVLESQVAQSRALMQTIKTNYDRLAYVMFLFEKPNRQFKKTKNQKNRSNQLLAKYFKDNHATKEDILKESKSALTELRKIVEGLEK